LDAIFSTVRAIEDFGAISGNEAVGIEYRETDTVQADFEGYEKWL